MPSRASGVSRTAAACVASLAVALSGCVYRINIQQGNVVEQEALEQVEVGMTRSQVQFLLGTPLISDPFHSNRWDYTYYFKAGRRADVERRWVSVYFEDDRVARIERRIAPGSADSETDIAARDGNGGL
ncbi:MAG TPA: outer membrane protein assembly factor BamE [Gammaproteobacteria bacterium]